MKLSYPPTFSPCHSDEEEEHNFVKFLDDTNFDEIYCHPLDPFEVRPKCAKWGDGYAQSLSMNLRNGHTRYTAAAVVVDLFEKILYFLRDV